MRFPEKSTLLPELDIFNFFFTCQRANEIANYKDMVSLTWTHLPNVRNIQENYGQKLGRLLLELIENTFRLCQEFCINIKGVGEQYLRPNFEYPRPLF